MTTAPAEIVETSESLPASGVSSRLIYTMAFASGAAALMYEVAWAKMLSLTFGSTTLAASTVVASFMGGMGIGAWAYHFLGERFKRQQAGPSPLALYGYLELGIALSTALLTMTFYRLPQLFADVAASVDSSLSLAALRLVFVFGLLILPAALLGATFPALCSVMIRNVATLDRHLGIIYGINTVGAALGTVIAGIVLVEHVGLTGTVTTANLINLAIGATAIALGTKSQQSQEPESANDQETVIPTNLPRAYSAIVLVVSGFATLAYEILWFRGLRYLVGNSTYALTVVLVVFLLGLGIGSLLLRPIAKRGRAENDLAVSQAAIAVLVMLAMFVLWLINDPPSTLRSVLIPVRDHVSIFSSSFRDQYWLVRLMIDSLLAGVLIFPATLLMGLSFPLASRLYLGDVRLLGRRVGWAYLLANIGSITGSIVAATYLLPRFGTLNGTKLVAISNLLLAAMLAIWGWRNTRTTGDRQSAPSWLTIGTFSGLAILMAWVLPANLPLVGEPGAYDRGTVISSVEGDLSTVQVIQDPIRPSALALTIDGSTIGATESFSNALFTKQQILAHLPMALDRCISRTLNVGLGSASTLEGLAKYEQIEALDCVEINQAVVDAAKEHFPEGAVLDDPRVNVVVDDALHFLLQHQEPYDLIISDGKQNPSFPGNAALLCRDFYLHARERLTDEGLFVQWMPVSTLTSEMEIVLRSFCDVFPEVELFFFPDRDVLMVGSKSPLAGRPQMTLDQFEELGIGNALALYKIEHPEQIVAFRIAGREQLLSALGPGPLATWDHNVLEFTTFKANGQHLDQSARDNILKMYAASQVEVDEPTVLDDIDSILRESTELIQRVYAHLVLGKENKAEYIEAYNTAQQAVQADPDNSTATHTLTLMEEVLRAQDLPIPISPESAN